MTPLATRYPNERMLESGRENKPKSLLLFHCVKRGRLAPVVLAVGLILTFVVPSQPVWGASSNSPSPSAPINYDECVDGEIDVAGEEDIYTFTGGAGDSVVAFVDNQGPGSLSLRLSKNDSTLDFDSFSVGDREIGATLPTAGTYTLTVDGNLDDTPAYRLCLNLIDVDGTISYDQCLSDSVSLMGAQDNYTFTGGMGDSVVVFLNNTGPGSLSLRLSRADSTMGYDNFSAGDGETGATLPETGVYTLTVDGSGDDTPGYTLCLNLIDVDGTISYDQCLSDSISVMGAQDNYTFTGGASDSVVVLLDNTGPGSLSLRLSHEGTSLDYDAFSLSDGQVGATLPTNGTYTLTVDGSGDDTPGYTLCLNNIDVDGTISYDECLSDNITLMGAQNNYTFAGEAGDTITAYLDNDGSGSLSLRVSRADSSLVYDGFSVGDGEVSATLPTDDIYTLTVDGSGDDTPGYTLCLNLVDVDSTLSYDECLLDSIALMGAQDSYTFMGGAGDSVIAFLDNDGSGSLSLRLSKLDSTLGYDNFSSGDGEVGATLPTDGVYTLTVDGFWDDTPNYVLCLNSIDVDAWFISYGQCISDSISVMGAQHTYTFNGWAGHQVTALLDNHGPGSLSLRLSRAGTTLDYDDFSSGDGEIGATLPVTGLYNLTVDGSGDDTPAYTLCLPVPTNIGTISATKLELHQNHPNPFNPVTTISFTLPRKMRATLSIYNVRGQLVTTLMDDTRDAGSHEVIWNGRDARGNPVGSGVYFYRLTTGDRTFTRKMVLLK
ncbi:MAG: T9SS type A sorting domain-containing protein [Candidatus Latescibacterota bacterium]|nr:MAG: T9SS type A sorting domain-containing protein [Candidatus Latescibacterota bacterium]